MNQIHRTAVVAIGLTSMLLGCAGPASVPPIPDADPDRPQHGKFVWYDLLTEDLPGVERFYGDLFGWTFESTDWPGYTLIRHDGRAIGGVVDVSSGRRDVNESQWISLMSVPDVDGAIDATRAAGGELHAGPIDVPGRGRLAVVTDPQGAVLAYVRGRGGDPPDRRARVGEWLWTELWTSDVDASAGFYGDLVDYDVDREVILEDLEYVIFTRGDVPRAGVIPRPVEEVRAHWLPYVRVEDPAALAERVAALGGRVLLAPRDDVRKGTVAIVLDPAGAALALQRWDTEAS